MLAAVTVVGCCPTWRVVFVNQVSARCLPRALGGWAGERWPGCLPAGGMILLMLISSCCCCGLGAAAVAGGAATRANFPQTSYRKDVYALVWSGFAMSWLALLAAAATHGGGGKVSLPACLQCLSVGGAAAGVNRLSFLGGAAGCDEVWRMRRQQRDTCFTCSLRCPLHAGLCHEAASTWVAVCRRSNLCGCSSGSRGSWRRCRVGMGQQAGHFRPENTTEYMGIRE